MVELLGSYKEATKTTTVDQLFIAYERVTFQIFIYSPGMASGPKSYAIGKAAKKTHN